MSQHHKTATKAMMLGALGIVFGDIGTSPLYTLKECIKAAGGYSPEIVYGLLSMIFWSVMIVVTLKYVFFVMRADNQGEGGILTLTALAQGKAPLKLRYTLALLGIFGAAMFYGDSMITPAISVLSAVEGLEIIAPHLEHWIIPIALGILSALFIVQKFGTAKIGKWFGPSMLIWFATLALLGIYQIVQNPGVLQAVSPHYALAFAWKSPLITFIVLGSVFLALTGGEALYADMGHFGRPVIQRVWIWFVFPALMLNYFGQGAMILNRPTTAESPFYSMAPTWFTAVLVVMATVATVIASQSVISGAFSMTKQAIAMGYLPRLKVEHTSYKEIGQVYAPSINWMLFGAVVFLVCHFGSSDNLASAYGIAVASTMLLTTLLMTVVARYVWKWNALKTAAIIAPLALFDLVFISANTSKILAGGWFPLAMGILLFTLMTTWKKGRMLLLRNVGNSNIPMEDFLKSVFKSDNALETVPGTAVFLNSLPDITPTSLMHNMKHNKVIHEVNIFITVTTCTQPYVPNSEKVEVRDLGHRCFQILARVGFKETVNMPRLLCLAQAQIPQWEYNEMDVSFFLNRETVIASKEIPGMAFWREQIFVVMQRNATKAADYFHLPVGRVVEVGSQVYI